jgi:hypothetical protein
LYDKRQLVPEPQDAPTLGGAFRNQKNLSLAQFVSKNHKKARFVSLRLSSGSKKHGISQRGTVPLTISQKVTAGIRTLRMDAWLLSKTPEKGVNVNRGVGHMV